MFSVMMMEGGFLVSPNTLASPLVSWLSYGLFEMGWRCAKRNFQAVEIKLDAKIVCDVLSNPTQTNMIISPIVDDYMQLAERTP